MRNIFCRIALFSLLLLSLLFYIGSDLFSNGPEITDLPVPVDFVGEYSIDGGPWQPFTENALFDTDRLHTTIFRGNFSQSIPEGQGLLLYIRNLFVTLKIDGETVYRFGDQNAPHFFRTPGITLAEVRAGPVPSGAKVELVVTDAYRNVIPSVPELLNGLYIGHRAQLYEKLVQVNGPLIIGCVCSAILGLLSLLLALVSKIMRIPYAAKSAALGFFALALGLWFLFSIDHSFLPLLIARPQTAAISDILSLYVMGLAGASLVHAFVGKEYQRYSSVFVTLQYMAQAVLYALQLLGLVQLYEAQGLILPLMLLVAACYVILALDAVVNQQTETRLAAICLIPATLGGLLECVNYFVLPITRSYMISTTGFVTTFLLLFLLIVYSMKQTNDALIRMRKLEQELLESKIATLLSQIQPHFLYNALTVIKQLCGSDPPMAQKAVDSFARYLRGNLRALTQKRPIPFAEELRHIDYYLTLEKMRFEEKLRIVMEIGPQDFLVPALSVQPIVENAVKHGVTCRNAGGTVTIRTLETALAWRVIVRDDGVGFDTAAPDSSEQEHIGIANVRSRLAAMCGGTLTVESGSETGTIVTIDIPKRDIAP